MMEITTDGLPPGERLDFWSHVALKRMGIVRRDEEAATFRASLRRAAGDTGEFWDHVSTAIRVERSEQRCRADRGAEIYVGLVLEGRSEVSYGDRRVRLRAGDVYATDFARPVHAHWLKHREVGVVFPRGADPETTGSLAPAGVVKLLSSHLRALASEVPGLPTAARSAAVDIAVQLARLALARDATRYLEGDRPTLLAAIRQSIARRCTDPEFSVDVLTVSLGCSRASLYRAFEGEAVSVAGAIWAARLHHARALLLADPLMPIGSVGFRSGFLDHANFSRMFRREFGMAPSDVRQARRRAAPGSEPRDDPA